MWTRAVVGVMIYASVFVSGCARDDLAVNTLSQVLENLREDGIPEEELGRAVGDLLDHYPSAYSKWEEMTPGDWPGKGELVVAYSAYVKSRSREIELLLSLRNYSGPNPRDGGTIRMDAYEELGETVSWRTLVTLLERRALLVYHTEGVDAGLRALGETTFFCYTIPYSANGGELWVALWGIESPVHKVFQVLRSGGHPSSETCAYVLGRCMSAAQRIVEVAVHCTAPGRIAFQEGELPPVSEVKREQMRVGALEETYTAMAGIRLVGTGMRLEMFRAMEGRYPARLEDLPSGDHGSVTTDPFSGEALRYRLADDGYILWSLGPNLVDDGGDAGGMTNKVLSDGSCDIVLWGGEKAGEEVNEVTQKRLAREYGRGE